MPDYHGRMLNRHSPPVINRRSFLFVAAAGTINLAFPRQAASQTPPPVRTITRGPLHHWFGYYDKLEFDPTDPYVLSNHVDS